MDTTASGTIAVLNQGEIITECSRWVGAMQERYPGQLHVVRPRGIQIARGRNLAVDDMHGHWLLFVDSDVAPSFDAIERLMAHDRPIVGGVVYERWPQRRPDGRIRFPIAASMDGRKLDDPDVPARMKLIPVTTVGMACTMIRRFVFEGLERPYFRCGQLNPEYLTEDTEFCLRAAAAGFSTHLDCEVRAGHRAEGILWPGRDGRRWVEWIGPQDCREPEIAAQESLLA